MKKTIKVKIENRDIKLDNKYKAIYIPDSKTIKYKEGTKTNVTLDLENNILIRENNDIYMEYIFEEDKVTDGVLKLKKDNKDFVLLTKTIKLEKQDNYFKVKYKLVETKEVFVYTVEVED